MASIDLEQIRREVVARLPLKATWHLGNTAWAFDFSRSQTPLRAIGPDDFRGALRSEWASLYLFGEEDFADGGGARPYLGVHQGTGEVFGLDVERTDSVYLLNSNIKCYINTFFVFDDLLGHGKSLGTDLMAAVRSLDPVRFDQSEWKGLVEHILTEL